MTAITIDQLHKSYGDLHAVDGVTFEVCPGEIFGMVGPNGAGKTTTIECLEGLRRPDGGRLSVLGLDPQRQGYELRERIGVQLQESSLPDRLKVREVMGLFAAFYRRSADSTALLDQLGLAEKSGAAFGQLSGGQKQRLFIALALINDPEIVFLDE
ncbi:MAG TPA: multidrug ABC transporter ATP-binding protein, partial [Candidatus Aminicenantes bacterium]|nr:multidrug ABC transporter ATP-binding protein [Candidatus Aminicenantes bacterium]